MSTLGDKGRVSIDSVLESLGTLGRYQIWQTFLLCFTNLSVAFNLLNFVFIAQPVNHQCENTEKVGNISDYEHDKCQITSHNITTNVTSTLACQSWSYPVQKQHSIVSEWDLVCDNVVYARLPQSLFIVGQGIGAVTFSNLSDRFGRKPFLIIAHILTGCAGLGLAFAPNITAFTILRLINGICQQGLVVIGITLMLETFPRTRRVEVATVYAIVWSICTVSLALIAYLLRNVTWRILQLSLISVSVTVILYILFLQESLRWLITNKKEKKVAEMIKTAARMNGVDIASIPLKDIVTSQTSEGTEENKITDMDVPRNQDHVVPDNMNYTCFDLFRSKFMLKISVLVWFTWFIDSLAYFSLYLTASSLADDLYLNFFLNSLAEVPSGPLFLFFGKRLGRRRFFMIFNILAGVCLLLSTGIRVLADGGIGSTAATIVAFVGKVGVTACFNGLFVYAPEIYPTNLRTVGFGAGSTAGRLGGCISPFISILAAAVPWAPGTMFGVLCLVTAGLNCLLPEPEGREMPQTIEDVKAWKKTDT